MAEDIRRVEVRPHKVTIEGRDRITVTSVEDVDSFNEHEVIFLTGLGMMTVLGEDLHIAKLNLEEGILSVEGKIQALDYADHEEQRRSGKSTGFLGRVFG